jgi:O-antigen/teichoic acid export membrane protein
MRGSAIFVASHVTGLAVSLVGSALLVRVASQQDVASYLMFLQAITVLGFALQLGLGAVVQRFVPMVRDGGGAAAAATLRRRIAGVQLAIWVAVLPFVVALWPALSWRLGAPELGTVAVAIAAIGAASSLGRLLAGYLRAVRAYAASAMLDQLGPRTMIALGMAAFFLSGQRVSWVALAALYSGSVLVAVMAQVIGLRAVDDAHAVEPARAVAPPDTGVVTRLSLVAGVHVLAATLLVSVDLWALSVARSHREVAVYGMMLSLLQMVSVASQAAQFVVPQEISRLHAEGRREELEALVRTSASATLMFAAIVAAGLVVLGRPFIAVVLGEEYVAGWGILVVLLAGRVWDAASGPAGSLLLMTGHHVRVTVTTLVGTAITVALAIALAPSWGGYGVAAATSVGLMLVNVVNVAAARRRLGVRVTAHRTLEPYRRVLVRLVPALGRAA